MRQFVYAIPAYIFIVVLFIWFTVLEPIGTWVGRDFPDESQIQYHEGTLKAYRERVSRSYISATIAVLDNNKSTYYYCSYAAHHSAIGSSCIDKKDIELYNNKPAKVGWYLQKDYLWYSNPHRQLISLEINGKTVISYQDTLDYMKRKQELDYKSNIFAFVFFFFFTILLPFFIPYYYIRKERRMQQSET